MFGHFVLNVRRGFGSLLSIRGGGRPARPDVTALETPTEAARLTIFLFPETLADAAESIDD